ncbi:type III polyketide synthase [Oerskovia flava]|uniref:type III polyketide synthase n=1 Tax=Oerskovia flava TaxID=2986422 RepID=UPI00224089FF|nr:3-oxoacyl-[acyl-carrier-protein] synthase III C-terminal domain-containing protein [Oerskovia sp. JB1-3-2]
MSRVLAVGPALPRHVYPQREITRVIGPLLTADRGRQDRLERLHAASGVTTRHLALPLEEYAALTSFGRANDQFIAVGTDLAEQACHRALDATGLDPQDVDFLLFTSVTGISAPSIDSLLVGRLGMRTDVKRLPSFGLGCVAGAAGLARVHDYLEGHPREVALLVSVELCSLTIQHGDDSMANLVSSGLFGDGAAAVVVVGDEHPAAASPTAAQPAVVDTRSRLYPDTADHLGWTVGDGGFGIVLSAGLPDIIGAHLAGDLKGLLADHDLEVADVGTWVVHAGGPRVLSAVRDALGLTDADLAVSRASLAAVGNLSSASVLHVLADTLRGRTGSTGPLPPGGEHGVLMAFGPGVSAELVLLHLPTTEEGS